MSKTISLTQNQETIVDDKYYDILNQYKWHCCSSHTSTRKNPDISVMRNRKLIENFNWLSKKILMHRFIMFLEGHDIKDKEIDHIDGNRLNNQICNLRIASTQQNSYNKKLQINNTSGYKGVSQIKNKKQWMAYINYNNKRYYLGTFNNKIDAARAYDQKVLELYKEFARTNFPKESYHV